MEWAINPALSTCSQNSPTISRNNTSLLSYPFEFDTILSMTQKIPNIFHFVFGLKIQSRRFHLVFYLCLESCMQINHPEKIYFYYHYEPFGPYWDLIKDKLTLIKVDLVEYITEYKYPSKYVKQFNYAHQSDFIRLEMLSEHGGVYADLDTIFVNPIPEHLFHQPFVLGEEGQIKDEATREFRSSLCNALIMSEPNAKFNLLWQDNIKKVFDGTWSRHSTLLPYELSQKYPELIHVEPIRSFYNFLWTSTDITKLLEGLETNLDGVYSIHLWSHLWWSRYRRDLTRFHQGLLTEEYIRNIDTTYNLAARRFLSNTPFQHRTFTTEIRETILETQENIREFALEVKRIFFFVFNKIFRIKAQEDV